jgi:parvulin-like peptidyl-prolyl isomerase
VVRKRPPNAQTSPGLSPEEAKTRAEAIRKELLAGTDLKKVAEDFKVTIPSDPKQDTIIQTEPQSVRRGGMRPEMEKAAFALKDGEYSEIFDLPQAQVILQVTGHKTAELPEVTPQIEQALKKQKIDIAMAEIKKKTTVWMDDQYFTSPVASHQPPAGLRPPAKP